MTATQVRIDPVTSAVIAGSLASISTEMGHKLARMSYSSIIRESEDFGCVLLDARGQQLCESPQSTPLQAGPVPGYIKGINRRFAQTGQRWEPGDIVIHNDAYYGASHGPDVAFCVPVFAQDQLVGYSVVTAHHLDIGALVPGTVGIVEATDTYAEGLQFNALKLESAGRRNETLWQMIGDNLRISHIVLADMEAQMTAARLGAERFTELITTYGIDTVQAAGVQQLDYSEAALRREIEKLPDGTYTAEGRMDGFTDSDDPKLRDWVIKVALTVDGSNIHVDLTGTSPQVNRPYNMPFEGTVDVAVWLTIRSILLDTALSENVPANSGLFRPITIEAPPGSMVNPVFPAPVNARATGGNMVAETVMRALAPVLPDRIASGIGNLKAIMITGVRNGQSWIHMEIIEGSYGGRMGKDGLDAVDTLYANTRNNPIEDIETHYPLRVTRYELTENTAGDGKWRGGLGSIRDIEFLTEAGFNVDGDGSKYAPPGIFGGLPGTPGSVVLNPGTGTEEALPTKLQSRSAAAGEVLRLVGPSAGGYGDPAERSAQARLDDRLDGFVSDEDGAP